MRRYLRTPVGALVAEALVACGASWKGRVDTSDGRGWTPRFLDLAPYGVGAVRVEVDGPLGTRWGVAPLGARILLVENSTWQGGAVRLCNREFGERLRAVRPGTLLVLLARNGEGMWRMLARLKEPEDRDFPAMPVLEAIDGRPGAADM